MKDIDIIILVEHINRELESAVLLKSELIRRNYSVEIVSVFWDFGNALIKYRPKLIITPWAYDAWEMNLIFSFYGGFKDGKFNILNTHQEQMTYIDAQAFMIPRDNARDCYHIAWGDYYKRLLLDANIDESLVRITGSPRLDFFKSKYWELSEKKEELASEYKLDSNKKWILIFGNFSFAFFSQNKLQNQYDRGNKAAFILAEESLFAIETITKWLEELCRSNKGEYEIIYRPHPSEQSFEKHIIMENKYKCFHVIREKTVRDWIVNSNACFIWNSTSSVEVAFADKPVFALRPKEISDSLVIPMLNLIPIISSNNQLSSVIDDILSGKITTCDSAFRESLSYYYAQSEIDSTSLTVDFVDYIFNSQKEATFTSVYSKNSPSRYLIFVKQSFKNLARMFGILRLNPKYRVQQNDFISHEMVDKIERTLINLEKSNEN